MLSGRGNIWEPEVNFFKALRIWNSRQSGGSLHHPSWEGVSVLLVCESVCVAQTLQGGVLTPILKNFSLLPLLSRLESDILKFLASLTGREDLHINRMICRQKSMWRSSLLKIKTSTEKAVCFSPFFPSWNMDMIPGGIAAISWPREKKPCAKIVGQEDSCHLGSSRLPAPDFLLLGTFKHLTCWSHSSRAFWYSQPNTILTNAGLWGLESHRWTGAQRVVETLVMQAILHSRKNNGFPLLWLAELLVTPVSWHSLWQTGALHVFFF